MIDKAYNTKELFDMTKESTIKLPIMKQKRLYEIVRKNLSINPERLHIFETTDSELKFPPIEVKSFKNYTKLISNPDTTKSLKYHYSNSQVFSTVNKKKSNQDFTHLNNAENNREVVCNDVSNVFEIQSPKYETRNKCLKLRRKYKMSSQFHCNVLNSDRIPLNAMDNYKENAKIYLKLIKRKKLLPK